MPSPWRKLVVFWPQIFMGIGAFSLGTFAMYLDQIKSMLFFAAPLLLSSMGMCAVTVITSLVKAATISEGGWDEYIPDACSGCKRLNQNNLRQQFEIETLKEALVTLKITD